MHAHSPHETHDDARSDETRMLWAVLLTGSFMVVEFVAGWLAGSLALMADAAHMLTDTASLLLAWGAARAAHKPADALRSYGYHRAQVLAAFLNGVLFVLIVGWIVFEAVRRLMEPVQVLGVPMLVVAVLGLGVNLAAFAVLHGGDRENLNVRAALLHVLGDLLGSVAAIVAAVVIVATGWMPIDPLLSVFVALLILRSAWYVVRESTHILLEGTPEHVDVEHLRETLSEAVPGVRDVHHVHVWSLTHRRPLVTLHVRVDASVDVQDVLCRLKELLESRFGIGHSTIQIERGECVDEH